MRVGQKNKLTYRWARTGSRPRALELNPQENIWQFIRASNRVFKSYDDIVDHSCYDWKTLVDQPWKIMYIARREWAIISQSL